MKKYSYLWKNALVLLVALIFAVFAAVDFLAMREQEPVMASDGLTRVAMLSEYCEGLKGTAGDEEVYTTPAHRSLTVHRWHRTDGI